MFSTSADTGEGSSAGASASGQQPVMFGGNMSLLCFFCNMWSYVYFKVHSHALRNQQLTSFVHHMKKQMGTETKKLKRWS